MNIDHRVFLVTGGASGLGAATARMLVAAGGNVTVADLNRDAGEALAAELGPSARFILTDIADEASGRAAVEATVSAFGALHGLVNCAGIAPAEKVLGKDSPADLALFAKVMQVNPMAARPVREVRHAVHVHAHCIGRVVSVDQTTDVGRYERCEIAVAKPRRRHRMKRLEGIHEYLLKWGCHRRRYQLLCEVQTSLATTQVLIRLVVREVRAGEFA